MPDQVSVRRIENLPSASFRFLLTKDTLAFMLTLPTIKVRSGLSPYSLRPCRAHNKKCQANKPGIFKFPISRRLFVNNALGQNNYLIVRCFNNAAFYHKDLFFNISAIAHGYLSVFQCRDDTVS